MTNISMIGDKVLFVQDTKVASGVECCCQGEPCCPCDGSLPDESCGLQSITVDLDFLQLGSCFPDGVQTTFSVTEADDDQYAAWSKRQTVVDGFKEVRFTASLRCLGGVGPEGQNCWAIELDVLGIGCSFCNGTTNGLNWYIRLPGVTQDGICCPIGRTKALTVEFCPDVGGTITITCVY